MKERKNLVMDSDGNITNWREDIEERYRYISQEVTIRKTELVCDGPYLVFKIECCERTIEIYLIKGSEITKIREIYSLTEAKSQKELKNKKMICYLGIDEKVWAVGSTKKNWIVNIYEHYAPYKEEQMVNYQMQRKPSEKEWEAFCRQHNQN